VNRDRASSQPEGDFNMTLYRTVSLVLLSSAFITLSHAAVASGNDPARTHPESPRTVTLDQENPVGEGDLPRAMLSPAFTNLSFNRPIYLGHAGDGSNRLFVIEQRGEIFVFENRSDVEQAEVFLNIRDRVFVGHNEEGLLALEFHPRYKENGYFYVWYSAGNRVGRTVESRRTVLSRFSVSSDDPNRADPDSELVLLEVEQPWGNHNGGAIKFGPDGYLYLSIGDGGHAGDPRNYSQNNQSLLGTIIRIDVNNTDEGRGYAIPKDNPFVGDDEARDEIWAYGLRNIWRMSFDRETGDLWAADVGQDAWEAVYVIKHPGGNYGWNIREGSQPFRPRASSTPLIDPVVEYSHQARHGKSITGGYVYRGTQNESLRGAYVFADYVSGKIWACRYDGTNVTAVREIIQDRGRRSYVTSFGEDEAGELYVVAFEQLDRGTGRIYRLVER
jgi:glucose/arabinose dehydrogenase